MSEQKELLILSMLEQGEKTRQEILKKSRELDSFSVVVINNELYYSEELLDILYELTFWGYVSVESRWSVDRLKAFYSLTEQGKKRLERGSSDE